MRTTWEKFQGATLSLARSGPIKERLADAFRNHLAFVAEDELPRELREQFRAVHATMTRERPLVRGEDAIRATIRKMSTDEADRVACTVVRMFSALPRNTQSRSASGAQVVSLHAAEA